MSNLANDLVAFSRLRVWGRGGERAPHKPLLALFALGQWAAGNHGPYSYADVERPLLSLLTEFGPPRRRHHPEFPFWHLQTDGVWVVTPSAGYPPRKGHSSPSAKQLRAAGATGQFTPGVKANLGGDPNALHAIAQVLLDAHFPPTIQDDVREAVGLERDEPAPTRRPRDRAFREAVLVAYRYACAVCRVGIRLGHAPVGVEAAHIRWHASGGPDDVTNGLCLCSLHHKLFDRGALTLSPDGKCAWVSEHANGRNVERALGRFHGRPLAKPNHEHQTPAPENVAWHHAEVFRASSRTGASGSPTSSI